MKNFPSETAGFMQDSLEIDVADGIYGEEFIRLKELTWEEYGISYGRILRKRDKNMFTGAITLNRLIGFHSAGLYMRRAELEVNNQEGTFVNIENGQYWYNEPARNAGRGWSGSIGFTYKRMLRDVSNYLPHSVYGNCKVAPYKFKIGASLLDIGAIRFNQGALYRSFDEDTPIDSLRNWTELTEAAIAQADGFEYTTWLPAAISIQYDHNLKNNLYFHANWMNRLSIPSIRGTERSNVLSASIRYETKKKSGSCACF